MPKIALQQPIIPDYRLGLFRLLRAHWGLDFQIYAGDADFGGSPASSEQAWEDFHRVENHYLFQGRFLWQYGCFRKLLTSDVVILNGNMRMLSNNILLLIRKLLGRRTLIWGHIEGQSVFARAIRGSYLKLCDGFIAYTESQAVTLRERCPWLKIWVAANSCIARADCVPVEAEQNELNSFLYVGRLVDAKKVRLLLEAFIIAKKGDMLSNEIRLVFVGSGPEREYLEMRAEKEGLLNVVEFAGHISDLKILRSYYRSAIYSVSPGYVGLSATQSFSFGVPMLIAKDEFHSPEIEAAEEGFNAHFFESDNPLALAKSLALLAREKRTNVARNSEIAERIGNNYSFEAMKLTFIKAVEGISNNA